MHLTPENAPVGARVLVVHGIDSPLEVEILEWSPSRDWFRGRWPGGVLWRASKSNIMVERLDRPEPTQPLTTPGDSVTIERDRAAMDALRRLAAKAMGISVVSDDVNVESLEAVVQARLGCIERELSTLRDLRRASERLPGEGDAVEWMLVDSWAYAYLHDAIAIQSGVWWYLATRGDRKCMTFPSVIEPHPDLHPVRVDGVWRWVRKEKV